MNREQLSHAAGSCRCCSSALHQAGEALIQASLSRRALIGGLGATAIGSWMLSGGAKEANAQPAEGGKPAIMPAQELVVQPALVYALHQRREQTSWRPWGGLMNESDVVAEVKRIEAELRAMVAAHGLKVKLLPVAAVRTVEEARKVATGKCDTMLIYASSGSTAVLDALMSPDRPTVFFLRHNSGPVSLWYEILHPHFLRRASDEYKIKQIDVDDVVVDEYKDLAWRLRALAALRLTLGQRIVAIGGAGGWGEGRKLAPPVARNTWHLDIRDVSYDELGKRIEKYRQDAEAMARAKKEAAEYLAQPGVTLKCEREAVENAFVLYHAFKELMADHEATAMTIQHCMGTVMPISKTTACLPLSLINDEGLLAFCESDFVVIPAGMLMHHITGLPVFLNDPTWPHHGQVTIAHCTAPRKLDGKNYEPVEIHTHFESDYGAAPKVAMKEGTLTTNVVPDFASKKWVGFTGKVIGNPFHAICRSQTDITIEGDWHKLLEEMRGFHWMTCYGDCTREVGYAIKKLGIEWECLSA
ncbi:MAG TPA: sugar isomerase [Phycisphaerae bacterium]|nr:sugar isomerase [Phycisphaerae bacterium]